MSELILVRKFIFSERNSLSAFLVQGQIALIFEYQVIVIKSSMTHRPNLCLFCLIYFAVSEPIYYLHFFFCLQSPDKIYNLFILKIEFSSNIYFFSISMYGRNSFSVIIWYFHYSSLRT